MEGMEGPREGPGHSVRSSTHLSMAPAAAADDREETSVIVLGSVQAAEEGLDSVESASAAVGH